MDYILENKKLKIKVSSFGAELKTILNKENNLSYLWNANPEHWKRSSPVLFPNVGKYYNGKYTYNGKEYYQGQHGFARDMEFEFVEFPDDICQQTADCGYHNIAEPKNVKRVRTLLNTHILKLFEALNLNCYPAC